MKHSLYEYQAHDKAQLDAALENHRSVCYCLPTGGGKTHVIGAIAEERHGRGQQVLMLVNMKRLLKQLMDHMDDAGIRYGLIAGQHKPSPDETLQLASIQALTRRQLARLNPGLIIVDECHLALTDSYKKLLARFPNAKVLGVTATPERLDGRGLGLMFDALVCGPSIAWLQEHGYLAQCEILVPSIRPDTRKLRGGRLLRQRA